MPRLMVSNRSVEVAAVIFDKDGTLTDFASYWGPLIEARAERLATHPDLAGLGLNPLHFLKIWGFAERAIRQDGILAQGSRMEAMVAAMTHLHLLGVGWNRARQAVGEVFSATETGLRMRDHLQAVTGVPDMVRGLVACGLKVAVASTATRRNIDDSLEVLGIGALIPYRVGSDQVGRGKPDPEMVEVLCRAMGVSARQVAVVGDGVGDMEMGRRAGVALTVGVLTGVDDHATLGPLADVIVPSAAELRAEPGEAAAQRPEKAVIHTDGAARGNPGPAAIGAVLATPEGQVLAEVSRRIGIATNNVAEYQALIAGLEEARRLGLAEVEVRADSELMVKQLKGEYKVRHPDLIPLYQAARALAAGFRVFRIRHVRREENRRADQLANHALDS